MLDVRAATDPVPSDASRASDPGGVAGVLTRGVLRHVLPGMVARGHGLELLCACLGLARAALLDLVVELDLPTPHDRPMRKPGGRNPWTFADTVLFVALWVAGWHAESLGERFGRTPNAVRSKARRLGLPARDRKLVFRPLGAGDALPGGLLQGFAPDRGCAVDVPVRPADGRASSGGETPAEAPAPAPVSVSASGSTPLAGGAPVAVASGVSALFSVCPPSRVASIRSAAEVHVPACPPVSAPALTRVSVPLPPSDQGELFDSFGPTPVGVPPPRKPKRVEFEWTRERDRELASRWWARQHYKAIARDMGISPKAVQDRRMRLELPGVTELPEDLRPLVGHYDPAVVEANIAAAGYHERKCITFLAEGKVFWFWTKRRNGNRTCKEVEKLAGKRTKRFRIPSVPPRAIPAFVHAW